MKIGRGFSRYFLWVKSLGAIGWSVMLTIGVFLPLLAIAMKGYLKLQEARNYSIFLTQSIIPIFCTLWPAQALQTYIQKPTVEIFSTIGHKERVLDCNMLFLLYLIPAGLCLAVYATLSLVLWSTVVKLIGVMIFLHGASYFLFSISKDSLPAFLFVILYVVGSITFGDPAVPYPLYYTLEETPLSIFGGVYLAYAGLGVLLVTMAEIILRKKGILGV